MQVKRWISVIVLTVLCYASAFANDENRTEASVTTEIRPIVIPLPYLNGDVKALEQRVKELEATVAALQILIEANTQNIGANRNNLSVNITNTANNTNGINSNLIKISANSMKLTEYDADITANKNDIGNNSSAISNNSGTITSNGQKITTLESDVNDHDTAIATLVNSNVMDLDSYISVGSDMNGYTSVFLNGANVYIRNGTGSTNGSVNGLGNLIVGYNEFRGSGNVRTGSHNLVVGQQNNYSSYGGMVAGYLNEISSYYSTVLGGRFNTASGDYSSVSGGRYNIAEGSYASVSGGGYNTAVGSTASVSGGQRNYAYGDYSSILGGLFVGTGATHDGFVWTPTIGSAVYATVSGGRRNFASGTHSSISGGSSLSEEDNYSLANPYHP